MNKTDLISFFLDKSKTVCKPGRYIGREWNSVDKDWGKAFLKVAILYPDVYEIGMSNQGLRLLYEIINSHQDFLCQRCFAPWFDMEKALRDSSTPLYSLEDTIPLSEFDVVAFSLQHELNYTNILNILDMSGIEIFSAQRAKRQPLVIGGGPCSLNPEPVADFFDFFVIGEAEDIIIPILEKINFCKQNKTGKPELL
ncbi:MAG: B12-binding domain-containing radical SAM protein, partial [Candidatus Omnitrophica bacterium]|nr:B12-binding domain-containing radical SAM protein [Candidatus Omnitrophota bacterium]